MNEYARGCRPKLTELLSCVGLDVTYTRARGAYLYRTGPDGREVPVLDLVGGFGTGLLGHNHPELRELFRTQLDAEMPFMAQAAVRQEAGLLAEAINGLLPTASHYLCHLSNSGAESIEAALKHAYKVRFDENRRAFDRVSRDVESFHRDAEREHPDMEIPGTAGDLAGFRDDIDEHNIAELERFQRAPVVLAFKGSFHGKTATALKVTFNRTYREGFEGLSAVRPEFIDFQDVSRLESILARHRVELLSPRVVDGRIVVERVALSTVIAFCLEVIQGEGGVRPVPDDVLASLAEAHDRLPLPLVVDEIQTGCGRTGSFVAFGDGPLGRVDPEYITLGKALGGGLTKVAATLIRDDVYDPDFGILHTSTFAEDELSCGVARHTLAILSRDDGRVMKDVKTKGDYLMAGLRNLQDRFPDVIHDVRGRGLMLGVEFTELRGHSPLFRFGSRQGFLSLLVASYLLHRHDIRILAPLTTLLKGNPGKKRLSVLRIQPAAEITRVEMDVVLEALGQVCTLIEHNNEAVLVAHLLDVEVTAAELRSPQRHPARNTMGPQSAEFDARVGFIMHPVHIDQVLRYYFPSLRGRVEERTLAQWWSRLGRFLEPDVVHVDRIESGGFIVQANLVSVPYLPRDLGQAWAEARASEVPERAARIRLQEMQDKIQDAVTVARELGDDHIPTCVVGLGAFTSIVTAGGTSVNDFEVPITTGNAYTAGLMVQGIHRAAALRGVDIREATAAVLGASGNIGSALAAMLCPDVGTLRLIGSRRAGSQTRLLAARRACLEHLARRIAARATDAGSPAGEARTGRLAQRLLVASGSESIEDADALVERFESVLDGLDPGDNPYITVHDSIDAVRDSDIVTIATSSPAARLISPEILRKGAIVSCASVPSNLSDAFRDHMREYFVFDGGFARLPGSQAIDCVGMPRGGLAFGCLSETLLLGLEGCHRSFARGALEPAQINEALAMAERHGFTLGDFKLNEAVHPMPLDSSAAA